MAPELLTNSRNLRTFSFDRIFRELAPLHAVALSIMQGTIQFGLAPPQFSGRTSGGGQRPSNCLTLPPTSRENLLFDRYSEYPHATNSLYIYKHPCFLRDLNPGRMTQQSVSLTTASGGQQNICA
ncbi:hypothetical protein TNCV_1937821 [Trichonephila clavipes]|nr:hypothetical protein TNCV_1937821 [Trichonephila clavipes]